MASQKLPRGTVLLVLLLQGLVFWLGAFAIKILLQVKGPELAAALLMWSFGLAAVIFVGMYRLATGEGQRRLREGMRSPLAILASILGAAVTGGAVALVGFGLFWVAVQSDFAIAIRVAAGGVGLLALAVSWRLVQRSLRHR